MAQVFLSYDREDAGKARTIAETLGHAGHSVWWDRHIQGGAEFGKVIERALDAADAVIVLWSTHSIDSAWVRDEAAAGRDKSRLIPVLIEPVIPPIGFRQYQGIDLSQWNGRRRPKLHAVMSAIDELTGDRRNLPTSIATVTIPSHGRNLKSHHLVAVMLVLAILTSAAIIALLWRPWSSGREAPLVAVTPASAGQPAKDLALDLLIKLGVLQSAHADALQLVDIDSRQKPDFVIKVGSAGFDQPAAAHIFLVDNRNGTLLWSREFVDPGGKQADLRQQMAYSAAQVLDCATQAATETAPTLKLPTLKLYLSGCADLSNLLAQDPRAAVALFLKVTKQAPEFLGGWKKLLLADIQAMRVSAPPDQVLRKNLRDHIVQARRLDPSMAETFLAEAWMRSTSPAIEWMKLVDRAVEEDPENSEILSFRSIALTNVGMMRQSLADTRRAVNSNPLSPAAREALIVALLNSGEVEAARAELAKAERLWPGATTVLQSRFAVEFREGDPALALRMMKSGDLGAAYASSDPAHEHFLRARIDPSLSNRRQAISSAYTSYKQDPTNAWIYARALSEFGSGEKLIEFLLGSEARVPYLTTWVLFRPDFADLHRDPRFMRIAQRFGALDYWRGTGRWPDLCFEPNLPYDCKAEAAKLS